MYHEMMSIICISFKKHVVRITRNSISQEIDTTEANAPMAEKQHVMNLRSILQNYARDIPGIPEMVSQIMW